MDSLGRSLADVALDLGFTEEHLSSVRHDTGWAEMDSLGRLPIHVAGLNGSRAVVEYLLEASESNLWAEDRYKRTALHYASSNRNEDIVRLLIKHRATVDRRDTSGQTPLLCAARNGHTGAVQQLPQKGPADVYQEDTHNRTPLPHAAGNGHMIVSEMLLD